jgi:hypothetical protein
MRMFSAISTVVLAGALSTGCLHKDMTQTIYISPGSATWSVIEQDVRSDEGAPARRVSEEHDYVLAVTAGQHPVAQAFRRLGAHAVTTTWLRRNRPYTVLTEARFSSLEQIFRAVLRDAQMPGEVTAVTTGCETRLSVRIDLSVGPAAEDSALDALIGNAGDYRLVLTEGRFVSADGFTISGDGTVAVADGRKTPEGDVLTLGLSWISSGCVSLVSAPRQTSS